MNNKLRQAILKATGSLDPDKLEQYFEKMKDKPVGGLVLRKVGTDAGGKGIWKVERVQ